MFERKRKSISLETLEEALYRLRHDEELVEQVYVLIKELEEGLPSVSAALDLPQSADHHAEGPFVRDHVFSSLLFQMAVEEKKLHLGHIVEMANMRGFEEEWAEVQNAMLEHAATIRVAIITAQIGKTQTIQFRSMPGSEGERLGFPVESHTAWQDADTQAGSLATYRKIFETWQDEHVTDVSEDLVIGFFLANQISISYPNASKYLFDDVAKETTLELAKRTRLSADSIAHAREAALLVDDVEILFGSRSDANAYERIEHILFSHSFDEEPMMGILQALTLILLVAGRKLASPHGTWHDHTVIDNLLHAENTARPERRMRAACKREDEVDKAWKKAFSESALDGKGLMQLLGMQPGPEFGQILKDVQGVAMGSAGQLPKLPDDIEKNLIERIDSARETMKETI